MITVNNATIYPNVEIGAGTVLEEGVIIGVPPYGKKPGELKTVIGKNSYIRARTIIYAGVTIGDNFQSGPFVFIRENNKLGKDICVWANSVINPDCKIGDGTRIHVGCFLESTNIGKYVFIAPHVTFTDDPHPTNPPTRQHMKGAVVEDNAIIGGGVTFLPHVRVGRRALIGAGSVVTKDIPPRTVAYGNPAKLVKNVRDVVCEKGEKKHYPYRK